jgi:hypothetical protein
MVIRHVGIERKVFRKASVLMVAATLACVAARAGADPPELWTWKLNTTGLTGYGGLPADVQNVRYSAGSVYVDCSSIPDYSIGPWPGNPNVPTNQAFLLRFPRAPVENTGAKTSTPLGPIGAWSNGVAIFNALDARSYMNQNIWHQNAIVVEATSFDACLGHPAPSGAYHHHQNASCLYGADSTRHSALLGYAFDGFPLYGPYAYGNPDGSGGVTRMRSGYATRNITVRETLPDGTVLTPSQYGPPVSATYPLGYYAEDHEYTGSGDLDAYNGRFAVTPEYPGGTYAYYVTVDATGHSVYPYDIGPKYYGVVATDNITSHGHVTISEPVTTYTPTVAVGEPAALSSGIALRQNRPNPALGLTTIAFTIPRAARVTLGLYDVAGHKLMTLADGTRPAGPRSVSFDVSPLAPGVYFYRLRAGALTVSRVMLVLR